MKKKAEQTGSNSNRSQAERVAAYLEYHHHITQIDALADLGVMRLASRISELKKLGYKISGQMTDVTNRYGEICRVKLYRLEEKPNVGCD